MEVISNLLYVIGLMFLVIGEIVGLSTIIQWFISNMEKDIEHYRELKAKLEELNKGDN